MSTLHAPGAWGFGKGGPFFVPLTREFAEQAWAAGTTKLPAESVELKAADFAPVARSEGARVVMGEDHPLKGALVHGGHRCVFLPWDATGFKGWIRCERGLGVSHAAVIREIGDDSRDETELTVFTDGRCVHDKRR